jgi:hypothetical protein
MKQVTITTCKSTIVVVDLPKDAFNVKCISFPPYGIIYTSYVGKSKRGLCIKTDSPFERLGSPSQVTEEQWKGIVDFHDKPDGYYRDYLYHTIKAPHIWKTTATESGLSLLKANGVVLDNPIGTKPRWDELAPSEYPHDYLEHLQRWQQAQEQVWSNPQIFIKLKGAS